MGNAWESMKDGAERAWESIDWAFIKVCTWFRQKYFRYEPNEFRVGNPSMGGKECYMKRVVRETSKPYNIKHTLRPGKGVISAISVLPIEKGLDSPETTIINGGVNLNFVELCLDPSHRGKWGCDVKIYGRG